MLINIRTNNAIRWYANSAELLIFRLLTFATVYHGQFELKGLKG